MSVHELSTGNESTAPQAQRAGQNATLHGYLPAIRAVARGEAIFSPSIAQGLIDFFAAPHPLILPQLFPELTEREREILGMIAQGYSNIDIARHLTLSLKTVANHVSNIFSKLQVADRAQAIIRAREAGLGKE